MAREQGRYEIPFERGELGTLTKLSPAEAHERGCLHLAVLAHALSGELQPVLTHYKWAETRRIRLSPAEEATIHFSLGVVYTRVSEYARARAHFARNSKFRKSNPRAKFFFYQGLGFYRYFSGAYGKSKNYARQAFEIASEERFAFGQLISEELMAHSLIEAGEVRLGMKHMRRSLMRARELGHKSLRHSFRLLLLLNEARFGLNFDCIPKLERALERLHPKDSHSRNAVKLELANQWVLRGNAERAYRVLDEACDSVYASQNRRQIAQLNFRLAYLTWLRGHKDEALHLLKSAELQLHKEVDRMLWKRMSGLRARILGGGAHARGRAGAAYGEDRIADLYQDVLRQDERALKTVLEHGLHFFLYPCFGLDFSDKALLFDLLPRGVIVADHGNIAVIDKGFSHVLRRILEALAVSHHSKPELIQRVWGYKYDPSRHDALVYTSVSKIRQLMGPAGAWIEVDEKGYRLQSGVRLHCEHAAYSAEETKPARKMPKPITNSSLSFRQLRILATFDSGNREALAVDEVMRDFAVSRATATRDLGELTDQGYLRRIGRARATRYMRGERTDA